ncbi:penicillin acylase family protein [Tenacibaculum sp. M341]|uniref:penicillin acylase family protein n=1 Tax=Tenacibaculum sp. M341 TaxID=2530339 RepID=UPI0010471E47|nr:penicillin acylase family protein [Tenacibaculum sp. M341]TCI90762.1 penicillin acylase family protein [Tenacibaculum sp. M341]
MKKKILITISFLLLLAVIAFFWVKNSNNFKQEGKFEITVNDRPIKIIRDTYGVPYVIAENKADVLRGQGFVIAQDRLFQIEFYRAIIQGKAAELIGPVMLNSDIKVRVLDIYGNAKRSYQYLNAETKEALTWYCEGFNEYLRVGKDEYPLEVGLLNITPKKLEPIDILSVVHFVGLFQAQNMDDEIISHNLSSLFENASELLPLSINLDRTKPLKLDSIKRVTPVAAEKNVAYQKLPLPMIPYPKLGSNNWIISSEKSTSGKPILANDPHVDSRILPGLFYPIGLICPEFKAVGIATPGIPGLLSGRNEFVSFGVTNAYGDSQDLFIEEIDGDSYIEEGKKTPFTVRKETINIKDTTALELTIRSTSRGPIVSDFPIFNILTNDVISQRWSLAETKSSTIGQIGMLEAKNVTDFRKALSGMDNMFYNYVFADVDGNIAHQSTGLVPIRKNANGNYPQPTKDGDNWMGFIPKEELPHTINPEKGWLGTANHDTRPDDYPYFYSNHFSPFYRYERLIELFSSNKKYNADELWKLLFDVKNLQAKKLNPLFVAALSKNEKTKKLADILSSWNLKEDIDEVGASVYTMLYNELGYLILDDELPDEVEEMYWDNLYYWNQRIDQMILTNHRFIDNIKTPEKETLADLIIAAGMTTDKILTERFGADTKNWTWGKLHTVNFVSPLRTKGFGKELLGGELLPKAGSNQTINRGGFVKNKEHTYETSWFSSFRMIADMNDNEKIMGIIAGGNSARVFHPYYKSQLKKWDKGDWIPYWISKDKVLENAKFELTLE